MGKKKLFERLTNLDPKFQDTQTWPLVNHLLLPSNQRNIYLNRELAVILYMSDELSLEEIFQKTKINKKELLRFVKRCLEHDEKTNTIWGFRALIPRKRISTYKRKAPLKFDPSQTNPKLTGAFNALLRENPNIETKIISVYLRKYKKTSNGPAMNGDAIHRLFLQLCEKEGMGIHDYPFNTTDKGYRSLYRFLQTIYKKHVSSNREDSNLKASNTPNDLNKEEQLILTRPYQRVQFDGHKIDAIFTITFTTPEGDTITEVLERIWLLVIVDVATRAILGHHLCVNKEYTKDDVLHCIRNAVVPYKKIEFSIPGLSYHSNGGLPSAEIPEATWALWNEFSYDNGKANLANIVTDRLYEVVGCTLNPGPVATPEMRGIIERLFRSLEELGYHKLVSTTGSNPSDPIRKNPELQAKRFGISLSGLEELTHILISDYNGIPHSGIRNFSPLQLMKQRIERGFEPRVLEEHKRKEAIFFTLQAKRIVKGNRLESKRPFITYEGVPYKSEILLSSPHLIGTELTLLINMDDIRSLRAFLPDGSEFGYLTGAGFWGTTPHSLRTRKAINKLKKERRIFFNSYDNPFLVFHEYQSAQARTKKRNRNHLANLERELRKAEQEELTHDDISTVPSNQITRIVQEIDSEEDDQIFRTYNF